MTLDPIIKLRKSLIENQTTDNQIDALKRIELNVTERCNRKCWFCPRADKSVYSSRPLYMSPEIGLRLSEELSKHPWLNRQMYLSIAGFGEPFLHPDLVKLVIALKSKADPYLEVITNGDFLEEKILYKLFDSGLDLLTLNNYEGPDRNKSYKQIMDKFESRNIFIRTNYGEEISLILNNRAGSANVKNKKKLPLNRPCFIPFYSLFIDWNGDALLCQNDWHRRAILKHNIMEFSLKEIWLCEEFAEYRNALKNADRSAIPCVDCDIDGCLVGSESFKNF